MEEAIILAGGAGTRLQPVLGKTPKCLAPMADGEPFLNTLLQWLYRQGITRWTLALGQGADAIETWLHQADTARRWPGSQWQVSAEQQPMGTGGALLQALPLTHQTHLWVVNADSLYLTDLQPLNQLHQQQSAAITLALVHRPDTSRYGRVTTDAKGCILHFGEKQAGSPGWINAGLYRLHRAAWQQLPLRPCSLETDLLPAMVQQGQAWAHAGTGYFTDMGTPDDYAATQLQLATLQAWPLHSPDTALFLDRDGVINIEKEKDYIHHWDEFVFYPDAVAAIARLSKLFGRIIVVTNQKGIGKGVTRQQDVEDIHTRMTAAIAAAGGRIDAIYFCPDTADDSPCRKPNAGMASQAFARFPELVPDRCTMVGNNLSDMQFAQRAGMQGVFLRTTQPLLELPTGMAQWEAHSLTDLANIWELV